MFLLSQDYPIFPPPETFASGTEARGFEILVTSGDYPLLVLSGAPATLKNYGNPSPPKFVGGSANALWRRLRLRAMPAMKILQATKIALILPQN